MTEERSFDHFKEFFERLNSSGDPYFATGGMALDALESVWSGRKSVSLYVHKDTLLKTIKGYSKEDSDGVRIFQKTKGGWMRELTVLFEVRFFPLEKRGDRYVFHRNSSIETHYPAQLFSEARSMGIRTLDINVAQNEVLRYDGQRLRGVEQEETFRLSYDELLFAQIRDIKPGSSY